MHHLQRLVQRTALEALAAGAVQELELRPAQPLLEDLDRFIVRVVDHDHLVGRVVELVERSQETLDDTLFVVGGDVHRHERLIAEVDVVAVSISVSSSVVAVAVPGGTPTRDAAQA